MKKILFIILISSLFFSNFAVSQVIVNENFEGATCTGNSAFNNGCVAGWQAQDGSPSINGNNTNYAWMWSYSGNGEAISTNANFIAGQTYSISFDLSTDLRNNNIANIARQNGQVFVVATNNAGVVTGNPTGDVIWNQTIGGNYFQQWQTITVCFTATQNSSQLWIYPFWGNPNNNQSNQVELSVDNIFVNSGIDFHFEHEDGTTDDTFSICEDVYLDGSQIVNPNGNFFMDIWRVNANGSLSWLSAQDSPPWDGWTTGQPTFVNVTQTFINDVENPVVFQAGTTYEVKLAINDPICGWTAHTEQFTYTERESPTFDIIDYNCYDGVYDVTVSTQGQGVNQWWGLYETSVEGSILGQDTIGLISQQASWQSPALTTITFTGLDPNKFYYVKHGVWGDNCPWQELRLPLDRDCCIDDPVIIPYCEDPCALDSFPLKVKDKDGNIITILDGATFSWYNATTGATSSNDIVMASEFEEWHLTLTMPDGCIYELDYKLICCEDDIQLEAYECPTVSDIEVLESQLTRQKSTLDKEMYNKYESYVNTFKNRGDSAEACDPCESGLFIIKVVDGDGNLVTNFTSIIWNDGLYTDQNIRWGNVDTLYSATVTVLAANGIDTCTYTDEIIYECETECDLTAPTNLQVNGDTLTWDPVPGAVGYIVESTNFWPLDCRCELPITILPIQTTETSVNLPIAEDGCFVLQVRARCADGTLSELSDWICVGRFRGYEIKTIEKVSITPNPTSGNMTFTVDTSLDTNVVIEIYNFYGNKVSTLVEQVASHKEIIFDGTRLPKGIYFVKFKSEEQIISKKIIIN